MSRAAERSVYLYRREISGLWLNYYNIPQEASSGEGYQEQEISIGEYELDGRLTLPEDAQNLRW